MPLPLSFEKSIFTLTNTNILRALLFIVVVFLACKSAQPIVHVDQSKQIYKDVSYLASDELEGRSTGTKGEQLAAAYIAQRFVDMGVTPKGDNGTYYQMFNAKNPDANNPHSSASLDERGQITGRNVIGYIDNNASSTVVIGGHYDHLGMGEFGSLHAGGAAIHNGADDNASGVAAVLALAERLVERKRKNNYLFILFSGEERGLWGSNYYTQYPTADLQQTNYMLNFDMVGRLNDEHTLAVNGTGTSPTWPGILNKINKGFDFNLVPSESGFGPSDHSQFYQENIPVIHFFTGAHEDYHKPSDDTELVNFEGLHNIIDYVYEVILHLDGKGKLEFTKTKDEQQDTPDFKVTLGVMPDYLYGGSGMRIDGVKEGRPAFKADLVAGDIVKKMGDLEIVDMMSYMKALGAFEPGQTIDIVIDRDGKLMDKKVTF